ncbi:MAG TPA: bifunctional metallophosphatase/5'-nucleotidase [Chitinophagaceae bacterium]|nr:bifunctional metallophosphatase/5'-nucleotidase [Chitinophagaceae bacterium]
MYLCGMRKHFLSIIFLAFAAWLMPSCKSTQKIGQKDDGLIQINLVQVNDVYEIAPVNQGREGGLARVASIRKKYVSANPNTLLIMAGDFLSPSVYNSLKHEGKAIRGKQMVAAMNAAGFDIAIFGNHEFDIREQELQERINESTFDWISSNAYHKKSNALTPFVKTSGKMSQPLPEYQIRRFRDADGTEAKIGFIGIVLPFNKATYVGYTDPLGKAAELYARIRDSVDAVVALTHQFIEDDIRLAESLPGLAAIIGGHEHDQRFTVVNGIPISKALANARSAYITGLTINTRRKKVRVKSSLEPIDEKITPDSLTQQVVDHWVRISDESLSSMGFQAKDVLIASGEPLEGRETYVRSQPTNLTKLIVAAMHAAAPKADIVLLNGGSVRVDDVLQMPLTQYDLVRALPFGGGIREIDIKGSLLLRILENGKANIGTGGYLHVNESLQWNEKQTQWELNEKPVQPENMYRVALTDFLLTGGEARLEFLKPGHPDIVKVYDGPASSEVASDIRKLVIEYIRN